MQSLTPAKPSPTGVRARTFRAEVLRGVPTVVPSAVALSCRAELRGRAERKCRLSASVVPSVSAGRTACARCRCATPPPDPIVTLDPPLRLPGPESPARSAGVLEERNSASCLIQSLSASCLGSLAAPRASPLRLAFPLGHRRSRSTGFSFSRLRFWAPPPPLCPRRAARSRRPASARSLRCGLRSLVPRSLRLPYARSLRPAVGGVGARASPLPCRRRRAASGRRATVIAGIRAGVPAGG